MEGEKLRVENLSVRYYPDTLAVRRVDLSLQKGEVLGIVGESGSGKSTLALSLTHLIPPSAADIQGKVFFDGVDLLALDEKEKVQYRGRKIAYVFQEPGTALNPVLTIEDQIEEVLELHQCLKGKQARQRAAFLLRQAGIPHPDEVMKGYSHQLSGGMKQRVLIAMALAWNPDCLVADEPTSHLDVTIQAQILLLLKKIQKEHGLSMLFITHDLGIIGQMADRIAVMYAGEIIELGPGQAILDRPFHPYTQGLLQCAMAGVTQGDRQFCTIGGQPPQVNELKNECAFDARCPKVIGRCSEEEPQLEEVEPGRWVRCFRWRD